MLSKFALLGLSGASEVIVIVLLLAIFVFEIVMLVSAIKNKHITMNARVVWIVGMFLIHPFVALAYYFSDYKKA